METVSTPTPRVSGTPAGMRESFKKCTTEMLVLFFLKQRRMYAYEMMQEMKRVSNGVLTFNTLYLAIYRLKDHGHIRENNKEVAINNRARVYFDITEEGRKYLAELMTEYKSLTSAVDLILSQDGKLYDTEA